MEKILPPVLEVSTHSSTVVEVIDITDDEAEDTHKAKVNRVDITGL